MTFTLDTHWVWDFWFADDGETFHLFYLHAPRSLGDQHLRHRNARIGHAVSDDLVSWTDLGVVLEPGGPGEFDESATWTGSVIQAPDGTWRMFYTGTRFLSPETATNVEMIGVASSADLHTWVKHPGPITRADPHHYETLGHADWPEEAWRDPWVFADPAGAGWHMLVTARATGPHGRDSGVIGHATSADLVDWTVQPPLSEPGAGFVHLEVPQVVTIDGRTVLLFSADSPALAGTRAGATGGVWALEIESPTGPFDLARSTLLTTDALYAGRAVQNRSGAWVLLAFENTSTDGEFVGSLSDPIPVGWDGGGGPLILLGGATLIEVGER